MSSSAPDRIPDRTPGHTPGRSRGRALAAAALVLIAVLALLWPALLNRAPLVFQDTAPYVQGAAAGLEALTGIDTGLGSARYAPPSETPRTGTSASASPDPLTNPRAGEADGNYVVSSARSPWYGGFLLVTVLALGSYGPAVLQGIASALSVFLAARLFLPPAVATGFTSGATTGATKGAPSGETTLGGDPLEGAGVLALVALASPLAIVASFMSPDFLTGLAVIALGVLLLADRALGLVGLAFWTLLLLGALLGHTSHLVLLAGLVPVGLILGRLVNGRFAGPGLLAIMGCVLLALAARLLFLQLVAATYGQAPVQPPFLTARLIADGTGYRYLRETCPENGFLVCADLDVMPGAALLAGGELRYNEHFLWSPRAEGGVFRASPPARQAALAEEQLAFALAVLAHDPGGVILKAFENWGLQLVRFDTSDTWGLPAGHDVFPETPVPGEARAPPARLDRLSDASLTRAYALSLALSVIVLLAATVLVGRAVLARRRSAPRPAGAFSDARAYRLAAFIAFLVLGLLANAAITGILSLPVPRYQLRVIWLVHLAAALALIALLRARQRDG
ncbi:MAG: hypothetical protein AAF565_00180 [Pseudomonadota bacterium]